jgi:hypothetical protein
MNRRICDYCSENWPRNQIKLSSRPNDEEVYAELCDKCLEDITNYGEDKRIKLTVS